MQIPSADSSHLVTFYKITRPEEKEINTIVSVAVPGYEGREKRKKCKTTRGRSEREESEVEIV